MPRAAAVVVADQTGALAQLSNVDKYTYFPNLPNNISKAQVITSDGNKVTSLIKVRKVPMIVLHVTFMEMNSTAARELGAQLGLNYTGNNFTFGLGGNNANIGQAVQTVSSTVLRLTSIRAF